MKKLFVLLLALTVVGLAAYAQGTYTIGASGTVTLYDQDGNATFARDGSGYDLLTFKGADKDGKWGYSATIDNFDDPAATFPLRDWSAWYALDFAKVIVGKVRNGDFRLATGYGWVGTYGSTSRFFNGPAYGVIVETLPMGGLTAGIGLNVPDAAKATSDVLQTTNIGVKYAGDGFGTAIGLVRLDLVNNSNEVNLGVDYTGMKGLEVMALAKITAASSTTEKFFLGGYYTGMDKLTAGLEVEGMNATALTWDIDARGEYVLVTNLTGIVDFTYDSASNMGFFVKGKYDFGNGLDTYLKVGYAASKTVYALALEYSISY